MTGPIGTYSNSSGFSIYRPFNIAGSFPTGSGLVRKQVGSIAADTAQELLASSVTEAGPLLADVANETLQASVNTAGQEVLSATVEAAQELAANTMHEAGSLVTNIANEVSQLPMSAEVAGEIVQSSAPMISGGVGSAAPFYQRMMSRISWIRSPMGLAIITTVALVALSAYFVYRYLYRNRLSNPAADELQKTEALAASDVNGSSTVKTEGMQILPSMENAGPVSGDVLAEPGGRDPLLSQPKNKDSVLTNLDWVLGSVLTVILGWNFWGYRATQQSTSSDQPRKEGQPLQLEPSLSGEIMFLPLREEPKLLTSGEREGGLRQWQVLSNIKTMFSPPSEEPKLFASAEEAEGKGDVSLQEQSPSRAETLFLPVRENPKLLTSGGKDSNLRQWQVLSNIKTLFSPPSEEPKLFASAGEAEGKEDVSPQEESPSPAETLFLPVSENPKLLTSGGKDSNLRQWQVLSSIKTLFSPPSEELKFFTSAQEAEGKSEISPQAQSSSRVETMFLPLREVFKLLTSGENNKGNAENASKVESPPRAERILTSNGNDSKPSTSGLNEGRIVENSPQQQGSSHGKTTISPPGEEGKGVGVVENKGSAKVIKVRDGLTHSLEEKSLAAPTQKSPNVSSIKQSSLRLILRNFKARVGGSSLFKVGLLFGFAAWFSRRKKFGHQEQNREQFLPFETQKNGVNSEGKIRNKSDAGEVFRKPFSSAYLAQSRFGIFSFAGIQTNLQKEIEPEGVTRTTRDVKDELDSSPNFLRLGEGSASVENDINMSRQLSPQQAERPDPNPSIKDESQRSLEGSSSTFVDPAHNRLYQTPPRSLSSSPVVEKGINMSRQLSPQRAERLDPNPLMKDKSQGSLEGSSSTFVDPAHNRLYQTPPRSLSSSPVVEKGINMSRQLSPQQAERPDPNPSMNDGSQGSSGVQTNLKKEMKSEGVTLTASDVNDELGNSPSFLHLGEGSASEKTVVSRELSPIGFSSTKLNNNGQSSGLGLPLQRVPLSGEFSRSTSPASSIDRGSSRSSSPGLRTRPSPSNDNMSETPQTLGEFLSPRNQDGITQASVEMVSRGTSPVNIQGGSPHFETIPLRREDKPSIAGSAAGVRRSPPPLGPHLGSTTHYTPIPSSVSEESASSQQTRGSRTTTSFVVPARSKSQGSSASRQTVNSRTTASAGIPLRSKSQEPSGSSLTRSSRTRTSYMPDPSRISYWRDVQSRVYDKPLPENMKNMISQRTIAFVWNGGRIDDIKRGLYPKIGKAMKDIPYIEHDDQKWVDQKKADEVLERARFLDKTER